MTGTSIVGTLTDDQRTRLDELMKQQKSQQNQKTQEMDKDAFLKILTTQLQYQDPLSPMDNKDFIAQMAQFSSVEQLTNIAETGTANVQNQASMSKQLETINDNLVKLAEIFDESNSEDTEASEEVESIQTQTLEALKELKEVNTNLLNEMINLGQALKAYE